MEKNPLFLALDFENWYETDSFLTNNELKGTAVKVGMELFYREGPTIIEKLKKNNHHVFLDLKLHDIPNTVERAMRNLASLGVDVVNVHAAGGMQMIDAARNGLEKGIGNGQERPRLIAVTQLTSTDEKMLHEQLLIQESLEKTVAHYAKVTQTGGADGVVCSVHEVQRIKEVCGSDFYCLTPGIRFKDDQAGDQKRIATPEEAQKLGSDALVMGRSITQSSQPKTQYERALKEWRA